MFCADPYVFVFPSSSPCRVIPPFSAWEFDDRLVICVKLLIQFYTDQFETLQPFLLGSVDMHVISALSSFHFFRL